MFLGLSESARKDNVHLHRIRSFKLVRVMCGFNCTCGQFDMHKIPGGWTWCNEAVVLASSRNILWLDSSYYSLPHVSMDMKVKARSFCLFYYSFLNFDYNCVNILMGVLFWSQVWHFPGLLKVLNLIKGILSSILREKDFSAIAKQCGFK